MLLTREEMKALADKVLKLSKTEETAVSLNSSQLCQTRFANNEVTTAGVTEDFSLNITVTSGKKSGSVSANETTDAALVRAAAQAAAIAEIAPADPEYVEPLGPQTYPDIKAFYEESARARSAELLPAVQAIIGAAEKKKVNSYGYLEVSSEARAVANSRGLFGYHRSTWASCTATVRTLDGTGSGWASSDSPRISGVDSKHVGETALRKAVESQNPQKLEPGKYTVILEPAALQEMLQFLAFSFGARAADEGRSFLSKGRGENKLGEKLFGENITLRSDPFDARVPGAPWSGGGGFGGGGAGSWLPQEKTTWIEKGVVRNLLYDRYWAQKTGKKPTPFPANFIMDGGAGTLDDLIGSTEKGLLVTRFWYIRFLQPQTVQLTGLTRDGVFYVEKGKLKHPVMNFRFNESTVNLLNNIEAMSAPLQVGNDILPAVRARDFNMASLSDAV